MTILSVPKPTLQAINKPYMISIQMFHISGDLHEGHANGITIACIEKKIECEYAFPDVSKSKHFKCAQIESFFLVRALET